MDLFILLQLCHSIEEKREKQEREREKGIFYVCYPWWEKHRWRREKNSDSLFYLKEPLCFDLIAHGCACVANEQGLIRRSVLCCLFHWRDLCRKRSVHRVARSLSFSSSSLFIKASWDAPFYRLIELDTIRHRALRSFLFFPSLSLSCWATIEELKHDPHCNQISSEINWTRYDFAVDRVQPPMEHGELHRIDDYEVIVP